MKRIILAILTIGLVLPAFSADSQAEDIMRQALTLGQTNSMGGTAYMVLREKDGSTTTNQLTMYTKKTAEGTNTYIEFLSPADVKGTRFLILGSNTGNDDQRLWLPELGKVRKIAASGKNDKFMGSDLTYYDMEKREISDSSYSMNGSGTVTATKDGNKQEIDCWIIISEPKDPDAPYSKMINWIGKDDKYVYKSEMYGQDGALIKTIHINEITTINGVLLATKTLVAAENGHKTLMVMKDIKINDDIDDSIFTIRHLQR